MFKALLVFVMFSQVSWAGVPVCAKGVITLRKGPTAKQPVTWKAAQFMPFMRTAVKGTWSKVEDLEGEEHWAKSSDLSSKMRCVVVKTNIATLRKEPSINAPPMDIKTVDRYTPFKRIGAEREWVQVQDESGRQAWLHESTIWKPVNVNAISF